MPQKPFVKVALRLAAFLAALARWSAPAPRSGSFPGAFFLTLISMGGCHACAQAHFIPRSGSSSNLNLRCTRPELKPL